MQQFNMFPNISRLFVCWRWGKVYSQTGWGAMAWFSNPDPPSSTRNACKRFLQYDRGF